MSRRRYQLVWNGTPLGLRSYLHFENAERTALILLRVLDDRKAKNPREVVQIVRLPSGAVLTEFRSTLHGVEWEVIRKTRRTKEPREAGVEEEG